MVGLLIDSNHLCNFYYSTLKEYENLILVIVFLMGLFGFKFLSFSPENKEDSKRKQKIAEEYLNKYKTENEEFFCGASDE
jgi:hypothetical protein